jgi:ABC-type microcin C transport system duplicated ATPase subunit YejF
MSESLLVAENVEASFGGGRGLFSASRPPVKVLHGVTVRIGYGETVGIVGESGSGKTTLARALLRLVDVTAGRISFEGRDITSISEADMRPLRRRMQLIFQDPMASLNPRHTIRRIVLEPMLFHRVAKDEADAERRARAIFERFSLPLACLDRYPHELSGGQRQRVGIARAALLAPHLVVADEIVSGLDVSTQAQTLNLLKALSRDLGLSMAFISHDLSVIRAICDRVYVLDAGRVVEEGACETVFAAPKSPYTRALIDAIPLPRVDPGWLNRNSAAGGTENGSTRRRSSSSASV